MTTFVNCTQRRAHLLSRVQPRSEIPKEVPGLANSISKRTFLFSSLVALLNFLNYQQIPASRRPSLGALEPKTSGGGSKTKVFSPMKHMQQLLLMIFRILKLFK